jgi:hypothetical protein
MIETLGLKSLNINVDIFQGEFSRLERSERILKCRKYYLQRAKPTR